MYGEDREEMILVLDNDEKFDRWMADYERKQKSKLAKASGGKGKGTLISNDKYLKHFARVHGEE